MELRLFDDSTLPLAVIVAATRWTEPPRMRHHIARQLMRWCNVLFIEIITGAEDADPALVEERLAVATVSPNGSVPLKLYSNEPFTHWLCNRRVTALLEQTIAKLPAAHKLLFNFLHSLPEVMRMSGIDARVYVCVDEFPRMWRRRSRGNPLRFFYQSRLNQWYENRVAASSDLCLSPHAGLVAKLSRMCPRVELLLHAHEFTDLPDGPGLGSTELELPSNDDDQTIHVCFMGFIHYRLRDDVLLEILRQRDMVLHMIGPVALSYDVSGFAGYSNVVWHGAVVGDALPTLLRGMDVLIIPYDTSIPEVEVLTSTSKIFQYIATEKPVVASNLPFFLKLPPEVLTLAEGPHEFVSKIRDARQSDNEIARRLRRAVAAENTWNRRGVQLLEIIRRVFGFGMDDNLRSQDGSKRGAC